jgi:hypothetical protein
VRYFELAKSEPLYAEIEFQLTLFRFIRALFFGELILGLALLNLMQQTSSDFVLAGLFVDSVLLVLTLDAIRSGFG